MRRDDEAAIVVGVAILLLMSNKQTIPWGDGWHWPVPDLSIDSNGRTFIYPATVSQEFKPATHRGLDIMYRRIGGGPDASLFPTGKIDSEGAKQHVRFFAPITTPILAARDGKVWSVTPMPGRGLFVVIDHGKPWATLYGHLARATVKRGDVIKAGDQIGEMGFATSDGEKLRHLHFEAWLNGGDFRAGQDAAEDMPRWERGAWTL
jgi:murein DD-endopeptidase MepM/ murein hydrolase activator NlpD